MSQRTPAVAAEKTFTSFSKDQGADYARHRRGYNPNLFKLIVDHHTSTGGHLDTLLDVGCGPGTAAREFASYFPHIIGIDPSEGMIRSARDLGGASSISEPIRFEISTAEDLGWHLSPPIAESSVDLITAATAAHWFDMERFWSQASRMLKPGGSVAIWTAGEAIMDPSMPNAAAIQAAMDDIRDREFEPFIEPGNILARDLYIGLPLPWNLSSPVAAFNEADFFRKEWGPDSIEDFFLNGGLTYDLDMMEKLMGTMSPVQRWREAHPDAIGTEHDVVKVVRREVERLLHEAGVEKGKEVLKASLTGVLLIVKKK